MEQEKKIKDLPELIELTGMEWGAFTDGVTTYKISTQSLEKLINPKNITFFDCSVNPLVVDTPGLYIFKSGDCDIDIHLTDTNFTVGEEVRFINYTDTYKVKILPYSGSSINDINEINLSNQYEVSTLLNIKDKFIII
jgi:hypothetical protein